MTNTPSTRTRILQQNEPEAMEPHLDTMQVIFRRAVAAILGSKGISCNSQSFEYVSLLAEEYMLELFSKLHKLSNMQRRSNPSITDLALLMRHENIQITELEPQLQLTSRYTHALTNLRFNPDEEELSAEALAFYNQTNSAKSLIPTRKKRDKHVPNWLPSFPPDHTFMATPMYTERITDPRQLREKIVEEGRLAEEALRRLTGVVHIDERMGQEEDPDEEEEKKQNDRIEFNDETRAASPEPELKLEDDQPKKLFIKPESTGPISLASLSNPLPELQQQPEAPVVAKPVEEKEKEKEGEKPKPLPKIKLSIKKAAPASALPTGASPAPRSDKKFDVLEYIKKRKQVVANREERQKERKKLLEQQATPQHRNPSASIVEQEYQSALASIQRSKEQQGDTNSVLDTVVNWNRD